MTSLARLKRIYDQATRLARIGAWECDLATEALTWTDGVYDLFDLPRSSEVRRAAIVDLYEDESRRQMERLRAEAIRTGRSFTLDARIRTRHGASRWMRLTADVVYEHDRPVRIFGAKQDITDEKARWDRLKQQAERDSLTGLANRRLFETRCHDLTGAEPGDVSVAALALIDLDDFKEINDGLGHSAGDECLRQVAERLTRALGDALVVARIGGDEFAVLLRAPLGRTQILAMLQRAQRGLCRPVLWRDRSIEVRASVGVTILKASHRRDPSRLLEEADRALYAAKAAGRNLIRVFGEDRDDCMTGIAVGARAAVG
jgi:diguanylate cyclase (GGDEF)-like protein